MLKKFANATLNIDPNNILSPEKALHSEAIVERFRTLTADLKRVAPRSQDFLYFVARGIHAMEAAAIDPVSREFIPKIGHIAYDNGHGQCKICSTSLMKSANGPVSGLWCTSSQVEPFCNQNGDAFSEQELLAEVTDPQDPQRRIAAYQTFVGRGLFTDHKSGQVENIRGIILDAAYDPKSKGVDLLIALDKVAYPELARQITAGYSTDVSMGCFTAGTQITLSDSTVKAIEDVVVGDEVLTHTGIVGTVYHLFKRQHTGSVYKIDIYGATDTLTATEEHPFYVLKNKDAVLCSHGDYRYHSFVSNTEHTSCTRCGASKIALEYDWKRADQLEIDDYVTVPRAQVEESVSVDPIEAFLVGCYAAEGSINSGTVSLCINSNEHEFRDEILSALSHLSTVIPCIRERNDAAAIEILSSDKNLINKYESLVGKGSHTKRLAPEIFNWSRSAKLAFLQGYIKGDGCFYQSNPNYTGRIQMSTCNASLANQILSLARTCGIDGSIQKFTRTKKYAGEKGKGFTTEYTTLLTSNTAHILNDGTYKIAGLNKAQKFAGRHVSGLDKDRILVPIQSIEKVEYDAPVYNFSVEGDNSYIANGIAVHNCQVSYSLCSKCGNRAVTEHDYCAHVREGKGLTRAGEARTYEVNNGLNFIEISMVTNGADPRAKIKTILASLNKLQKQKRDVQASESENQLIVDSINRIADDVQDLEHRITNSDSTQQNTQSNELLDRIAKLETQIQQLASIHTGGKEMTQKKQDKKAYMQGTVEPDIGNVFDMSDKDYHQYWEEDKHMVGPYLDGNGTEGLAQGYGMGSDEDVKKMYLRANTSEGRRAWRDSILKKLAYMQGTVEPDLKNVFDMSDKDYHQYWEEDKQMVGQGIDGNGTEGMSAGYGMGSDEQVKKELLRATLRAKLSKAASRKDYRWEVYAGDEKILVVTAGQAYGQDLDQPAEDLDASTPVSNFEWFASKPYGVNLIQAIKQLGLSKVASQVKVATRIHTAQEAPAPTGAPAPDMGAAPTPDMGAAPAPDADASSGDEEGGQEMEASEAIRTAADQIEEAVDQIKSMVDELDHSGDQAGAAEGTDLANNLGDTANELGGLSGEVAAGPATPAQAAALNSLVRYALSHADQLMSEAEQFGLKFAAKKKDKKKKMKKNDKKKKMPPWMKKKSSSDLLVRRAARRKIAEELLNLTEGDIVAEAHPDGGNDTTFPGQPSGKIETQTEQQEQDMDVANSMPRGELVARVNNRQRLVQYAKQIVADQVPTAPAAQKVDEKTKELQQAQADLDKATSSGSQMMKAKKEKKAEVDNETRQYYTELASESATGTKPDPEVSKFYKDLTQDFYNKKSTAAVHNQGIRMKRAYALAMRRANLGQIESTTPALEADVDRLMRLDDEQFTAFANVVENTKATKTQASAAPKQVRTAGALQVGVRTVEDTELNARDSMVKELVKLPWK